MENCCVVFLTKLITVQLPSVWFIAVMRYEKIFDFLLKNKQF